MLVILIAKNSAQVKPIRDAMASCGLELLRVTDVPMALARIGGGGVASAILDWSSPASSGDELRQALTALRQKAPHIPVIVLGAGESVGLRESALRAGASGYLVPDNREEIGLAVRDAISRAESPEPPATANGSRGASVIALLGAKGGVGTTMLAWNIAELLAQRGSVVLAEIRPAPGSLAYYFRPGRTVRRLSDLLDPPAASTGTGARAVDTCLWSHPSIPGLRVLFGPQTPEECREIDARAAKTIVQSVASTADYVVLDLPASISPANRAILEESDYLALVVEREPVCVEAAKNIFNVIESWGAMPTMSGLAIVNRAPLVSPLPIEDIEARFGLPILTVIPPAPDLCLQSQKARIPIVQLDPESLVANSIVALARGFQAKSPQRKASGALSTSVRVA